jgi:hypothetical protein
MAVTHRAKRKEPDRKSPSPEALAGLRALRRAARRARETARRFGTPIYVMKDGRVVALKP